jgi:hypothetical protein
VPHPDRDRAARARLEADAVAVEIERGFAGEDVERRLERMEMAVDVAVGQLDQRQTRVCGAVVAPDQDRTRQSSAVSRQRRHELDLFSANQDVHSVTSVI